MLQIVIIIVIVIVVVNCNSISNSSYMSFFEENSILSRHSVYHKFVKTDEENTIYQLTWCNMPEGWNLQNLILSDVTQHLCPVTIFVIVSLQITFM